MPNYHTKEKIIILFLFLFRSTGGMEQVEHMKQVWSIIQMADMPLSAFRRVFLFHLFHLFRLFHTFHGTERNMMPESRPIFVPSVPLVPLIPWNGTEQGRWSWPIDTAAPRPLQEKAVKASSLR